MRFASLAVLFLVCTQALGASQENIVSDKASAEIKKESVEKSALNAIVQYATSRKNALRRAKETTKDQVEQCVRAEDLRQEPVPDAMVQQTVDFCTEALKAEKVDWEAIVEVLQVGTFGVGNERLVDLADAVVTCRKWDPDSGAQIGALFAAIGVVGYQNVSRSGELLQAWATRSFWREQGFVSRRTSADQLQGVAIASMRNLSYDKAKECLSKVEDRLKEDGQTDGPVPFTLKRVQDEIERKAKGLPPASPYLRE